MAVGLRIKFDGGTQDQYDAIHSHMKIDENPPDGMIFHSAGPIEGGLGVARALRPLRRRASAAGDGGAR